MKDDPIATPLNVRYPLVDYLQVPGGCLLTGIVLLPGQPQQAFRKDGSPAMVQGPNGLKPLMLPGQPVQHPVCTWFVPGVYAAQNLRHKSTDDKPENYRLWLIKLGTTPEEAGLVGPPPEVVEMPAAEAEELPAPDSGTLEN